MAYSSSIAAPTAVSQLLPMVMPATGQWRQGKDLAGNLWVKVKSQLFPICKPETRANKAYWCLIRDKAKAYQEKINGGKSADISYEVENPNTKSGVVSFDGFDAATNTLKDAKYGYGSTLFKKIKGTDEFEVIQDKQKQLTNLFDEAIRQAGAISDKPDLKIEWHFSNNIGPNAVKEYFLSRNDVRLAQVIKSNRFKFIYTQP
jgi:hypothetical protein